jgi:thiamine biosynthesis lipoprotein
VPGWRCVEVDERERVVRLPPGVELDLGATAKALAADRAAAAGAAAAGAGVLVSLGGDVAVAGPPPEGGWPILVADDHARLDEAGPTVAIESGGLATSGTAVRRWRAGGAVLHHLIDPRTGRPAVSPWRTVSVAGASCVDANIASTAAVVLGDAAPEWLGERRLPARLVSTAGDVALVAGWPS